VVGSGPAGMAAAQQLARAGHDVTLFEKNDRVGGLLRYGIPDFKMEKHHIDRRVEQMKAEGVTFRTGVMIGELPKGSKVTNWAKETISPEQLQKDFDAVLLTGGAEQSRDLPVPGRDLDGIHFAMEFLPQQNKVNAGDKVKGQIRADGKHVIVIGGGDTGSDCVGTSNRHGAASVVQFELMPQPPEEENKPLTWPYWPYKLRTSSSHEEGVRARVRHRHQGIHRRKGQGHRPEDRARRVEGRQDRRSPRQRAGATRPTWCCWPWASSARSPPSSKASASTRTPRQRQGHTDFTAATRPTCPRCSPPATCAAASRWWSGRSAKAGRPARGRRIPDGIQRPAALKRHRCRTGLR
jgi:NADPH-dependent glutamate synthase beta subunit-like oxidoreductase